MLTADGVPVLMHDETLDRTTGGRGRLARRDWAAVARLDAGRRFHRAWAGEPVPRLADALALCAALGLTPNVEIKPAAGQEARTGAVVAQTVQGNWPAGQPLLLSSFSAAALKAAREAAPAWPRALLVGPIPADWRARMDGLGCAALHVRAADLTPGQMQEVAAAGVPVAVYTVNTAAEAERCLAMGVTALFTDRLDAFAPGP